MSRILLNFCPFSDQHMVLHRIQPLVQEPTQSPILHITEWPVHSSRNVLLDQGLPLLSSSCGYAGTDTAVCSLWWIWANSQVCVTFSILKPEVDSEKTPRTPLLHLHHTICISHFSYCYPGCWQMQMLTLPCTFHHLTFVAHNGSLLSLSKHFSWCTLTSSDLAMV